MEELVKKLSYAENDKNVIVELVKHINKDDEYMIGDLFFFLSKEEFAHESNVIIICEGVYKCRFHATIKVLQSTHIQKGIYEQNVLV